MVKMLRGGTAPLLLTRRDEFLSAAGSSATWMGAEGGDRMIYSVVLVFCVAVWKDPRTSSPQRMVEMVSPGPFRRASFSA